jgi:hypothetical protein
MGLLKYAASRLKYVLKRLWAPTKAAAKRATPDKATVFSKRTAPLMLYDWQDSTPPSQTIGSCQQLLAKLITKKVRTVTALLTAWRVPPTVPMPAESPFQGVSPARRGRAGVVGRTHHAASLCGTDAPRLTSPILVLLAQQPRVRGQKPQPAWQEVARARPQVWVWTGDAVYPAQQHLIDTQISALSDAFATQLQQPGYRAMLAGAAGGGFGGDSAAAGGGPAVERASCCCVRS